MEGAVVKFTVPTVFQDVLQAELVLEAEDTIGVGF